MRRYAAVLVVTITGCCWPMDQSCVMNGANVQTCVDLPPEYMVCFPDDPPADPPPSPGCGGELHDESCAALGFTVRCDGYALRPGARC